MIPSIGIGKSHGSGIHSMRVSKVPRRRKKQSIERLIHHPIVRSFGMVNKTK